MFFSVCRYRVALRRNPIRSIASRDKFSLARSAFSGPVLFLSTPMPPWHHCVIDIAPIHLALLFHTSRTICGSVMIDFWLPRAKKHSFSAKSDSRAGRTRCSVGLRRSKRGSTKFNTFAESIFLRLPRSCRVAEKPDPIDRFSGPNRRKSREIDGFYRISRRRDTIEPNGEKPP